METHGERQTFRLEHLHTAMRKIEWSIPYTVCPHCWTDHPGRANADCRSCYGSGVVPKLTFERVAEDLRLAVKHRDESAAFLICAGLAAATAGIVFHHCEWTYGSDQADDSDWPG
jgi:hypothetical protein